jgi:hypothetical protein
MKPYGLVSSPNILVDIPPLTSMLRHVRGGIGLISWAGPMEGSKPTLGQSTHTCPDQCSSEMLVST